MLAALGLGLVALAGLAAGLGCAEGAADSATDAGAGAQAGRVGMGEIDRAQSHEWPPIALDSSGAEHAIVMQAPDPGWWIQLDGVEATPAGKIVYATIRRPAPGRMYPQVITEMRLGTTVPAREAAELVVRVAEINGSANGPYHPLAGTP